MGNPAQWSFHALRAHPGLGSAHLSCRATWMLLDRAPSWRQRRWPQPVNEAQDLSEQRSWDGDLRHLKRDEAAMTHDLGADLDQLLQQSGRRPMLHRRRQRQSPLVAMNRHPAARNRSPLFPQLRTFSWPSLTSGLTRNRLRCFGYQPMLRFVAARLRSQILLESSRHASTPESSS